MIRFASNPHEHCRARDRAPLAAHSGAFSRGVASTGLALAILSGCAHRTPAPVPLAPRAGEIETGIASWYGYPYHGRRAANGEIYDMEQFTAAHRTLPFGTWVEVDDLDNGKRVDVRINDRGPFVDGRIIDLSRAAARAIDMLGPGTARVSIRIIPPPAGFVPPSPVRVEVSNPRPASPPPRAAGVWYAVETAAFVDRDQAEQYRIGMLRRYGAATVVLQNGNPPVWRVLVGREGTIEGASALADRIRAELGTAQVVRLDP